MDRIERRYYLEVLWNETDGWKICRDGNDLKAVYAGEFAEYPFKARKTAEKVIDEIRNDLK